MKKSKQTKASKRIKKSEQTKASKRLDGVDIISNFPDHVLQLILSRLQGTEEAVRTSILSRRWRYLWTSIPSIDIDCNRGLKFKKKKFKKFVDHVLANNSLDLDSFRLSCSSYYKQWIIWRWVQAAVNRNIKQLHLYWSDNIKFPNWLLTYDSLEVLRLSLLVGNLSLLDITGFSSLRVLELKDVTLIHADLVETFFKSCPLLEDLSLVDCIVDTLGVLCISCHKLKNLRIGNRKFVDFGEYLVRGDLRISCPELVFLELKGTIAFKFFFDSLDSLKKAVIHPQVYKPAGSDFEHEQRICEVFAGISHVESLSISISFLSECIDGEVDVAVSLPNLKTLEITIDCWNTDAVQFIKCFPDLESLHLNIIWDDTPLKYWKLNDAATMRILTRQLKKVEYLNFNGQYHQLKVACFFLRHGNALEEMVFIWVNEKEARYKEDSMEITLLKHWTTNIIHCYYNLSSKV